MIVVIIAGGSGSRLWPLSTQNYPKHLLSVNGDKLSLLQQTHLRAKSLTDKIYVVSEAGHIDSVKEQLPELLETSFIVEPARRGTANCILASLREVAKNHDSDEPIVFMHSDHYIRDIKGFAQSFRVAVEVSQRHQKIVLIGIEPNYPATGFGYIQKSEIIDETAFVSSVQSFKEKPNYAKALEYLESGDYLWNAGYFVGSEAIFRQAMESSTPELYDVYKNMLDRKDEAYTDYYLSLENISIDYALIEKLSDLLVLPANFDWMDLGSFSDLHKAVLSDESGNCVHGKVELEGVENSYIYNNEDKPMAVIGLDNIAVINTPNGILVVRKDLSQKVGDVSKRFQEIS